MTSVHIRGRKEKIQAEQKTERRQRQRLERWIHLAEEHLTPPEAEADGGGRIVLTASEGGGALLTSGFPACRTVLGGTPPGPWETNPPPWACFLPGLLQRDTFSSVYFVCLWFSERGPRGQWMLFCAANTPPLSGGLPPSSTRLALGLLTSPPWRRGKGDPSATSSSVPAAAPPPEQPWLPR